MGISFVAAAMVSASPSRAKLDDAETLLFLLANGVGGVVLGTDVEPLLLGAPVRCKGDVSFFKGATDAGETVLPLAADVLAFFFSNALAAPLIAVAAFAIRGVKGLVSPDRFEINSSAGEERVSSTTPSRGNFEDVFRGCTCDDGGAVAYVDFSFPIEAGPNNRVGAVLSTTFVKRAGLGHEGESALLGLLHAFARDSTASL
jgi:hypothetical protein